MFDLNFIRENPETFDALLARRGEAPASAALLELDAAHRTLITKVNEAQARRNEASKLIGAAMRDGDKDKAEALKAEVSELKGQLSAQETESRTLEIALQDALMRLPNMVYSDVPDGASEDDNVEVRRFGTPADFSFEAKEHFDLGEALGLMDFERAAKLSGARFVILKGELARLERALGQFMLDVQTREAGYEEIVSPVLVRAEALSGTGQLPKFEEDLFKTQGDHYLIPTAEATLTNIYAQEILSEEDLPVRLTALTQCFRAEAGSAGRDTRGMIRQHQFAKVELVSIVAPDQSDAELERKTAAAENILQKLALPYRTVKLCTGDIGFGARRTYDIEVWLPGQKRYREISSCSTCGDFQARRMKLRYRRKGEKKTTFPHTLNGSGLAVGRTLIAVMENYQQANGSIRVPDVLKPYMGGVDVIGVKD